jgi:hypothetical protein
LTAAEIRADKKEREMYEAADRISVIVNAALKAHTAAFSLAAMNEAGEAVKDYRRRYVGNRRAR